MFDAAVLVSGSVFRNYFSTGGNAPPRLALAAFLFFAAGFTFSNTFKGKYNRCVCIEIQLVESTAYETRWLSL